MQPEATNLKEESLDECDESAEMSSHACQRRGRRVRRKFLETKVHPNPGIPFPKVPLWANLSSVNEVSWKLQKVHRAARPQPQERRPGTGGAPRPLSHPLKNSFAGCVYDVDSTLPVATGIGRLTFRGERPMGRDGRTVGVRFATTRLRNAIKEIPCVQFE